MLVIDDDPLFRTLIKGTLSGTYPVITASDGHEGYQGALTATPRLVLLDLMMPTWGGVETLRAFRTDAVLRSVPVIMLTGVESGEEFDEAISIGVQAVVRKTTITAESLRDDVARVLADRPKPKPYMLQTSSIPVAAQRFDG